MPEPWRTMRPTRCSTWRGWPRSGPTRTANAWKLRSAPTPNTSSTSSGRTWPGISSIESLHTSLVHDLWQAVNVAGARTEDLDPVYAASLQQLDALDEARRSRVLLGEDRLPEAMTLTLIIGAVVTVGFSYFFAVEDGWIQGLMTASLATLVALLLLLEYQLDTPYEGVSAIEPTAMELVRTEIDAGLGAIGGQS